LAAFAGAAVFLFFAVVIVFVLLIRFLGLPAGRSQVTKNPRPFPAVGSCRNCCLPSTRSNGVGNYDDQQVYLNKGANHRPDFKPNGSVGSSVDSAARAGHLENMGSEMPPGFLLLNVPPVGGNSSALRQGRGSAGSTLRGGEEKPRPGIMHPETDCSASCTHRPWWRRKPSQPVCFQKARRLTRFTS
jgi:hypothetical protein